MGLDDNGERTEGAVVVVVGCCFWKQASVVLAVFCGVWTCFSGTIHFGKEHTERRRVSGARRGEEAVFLGCIHLCFCFFVVVVVFFFDCARVGV